MSSTSTESIEFFKTLPAKTIQNNNSRTEQQSWLSFEQHKEQEYSDLVQSYMKQIMTGKLRQYQVDSARTLTLKKGAAPIQPFVHNRCLLSSPFAQTFGNGDTDTTFVNASPMPNGFIAAGIPQNELATIAFWHFIAQYEVKQVVMLNRSSENENHPYWPYKKHNHGDIDLVDSPQQYGSVKVTLVEKKCDKQIDSIYRRFKLQVNGKSTTLDHYQTLDWPDMRVPFCKNGFIEFVKKVMLSRKKHNGVVVTHCFGGAGRTGTFICICLALIGMEQYKLGRISSIPHISEICLALRNHRADQVQTAEQYKFIYRIVYEMINGKEILSRD